MKIDHIISKLIVAFLLFTLSACGSLNYNKKITADKNKKIIEDKSLQDTQQFGKNLPESTSKLVAEGIHSLEIGKPEIASKLFNIAIKFDPQNASYHLLSGLAYHLQFKNGGSSEMRDNAEVGYLLAAKFNPGNSKPYVQLGRLALDAKEYNLALNYFSKSIEYDLKNTDGLFGLAQSSYLIGEFKTTFWATDRLEKLNWNPTTISRMKSVLAAISNDSSGLNENRIKYAQDPNLSESQLKAFNLRLNEISSKIEDQMWLQESTSPYKKTSDSETLKTSNTPQQNLNQNETDKNELEISSDKDRTVRPWYDCLPANAERIPQEKSDLMTRVESPSEETVLIKPIPRPCLGAPNPKMIQMDAFIILSEDENNRSYGVNLLQGLYGFFGKLSTVTEDTAAAGRQSTVVYTSGIGTSSSAASLSYSLNIANALTNRNEVIARPTLTAIDGLPSTFFSGSTLSVSVGGTVGSISNLVEKPVGLSVSITPTIIDDDTVMIAVRLVRSFIQIPTAGTSNVLVQTSRNSSSASIIARYGETVVLGGLSERDTYSTDSGVPVLKNIPIVQYLFNTYASFDYTRSVMMMITPRKPVVNEQDFTNAKAEKENNKTKGGRYLKKYAFQNKIDEFQESIYKGRSNSDKIFDVVEKAKLYKQLGRFDFDDKDWTSRDKLDQMLIDLKGLLIH